MINPALGAGPMFIPMFTCVYLIDSPMSHCVDRNNYLYYSFVVWHASILQALGNPDATEKIMRAISYYSVTNIEAFIFCYAGEYLINQVSDNNYDDHDIDDRRFDDYHAKITIKLSRKL